MKSMSREEEAEKQIQQTAPAAKTKNITEANTTRKMLQPQ